MSIPSCPSPELCASDRDCSEVLHAKRVIIFCTERPVSEQASMLKACKRQRSCKTRPSSASAYCHTSSKVSVLVYLLFEVTL
jgi:hypothetical protein